MDGFKALFEVTWKTYIAGAIIIGVLVYNFAVQAPYIFIGVLIGVPAITFYIWQRGTRRSDNPWH